jgi:negative regulator of flagellin synthesis FlgM
MRVGQTGTNSVQGGEAQAAKRTGKAQATLKKEDAAKAAAASSPAVAGGTPEISARAKEMARAKAVADGAPDTREAKIAELKKRIAEGSYKVDAKAVADRMVDDHLSSGIG